MNVSPKKANTHTVITIRIISTTETTIRVTNHVVNNKHIKKTANAITGLYSTNFRNPTNDNKLRKSTTSKIEYVI